MFWVSFVSDLSTDMGILAKDAFRTMVLSYVGTAIGYLNKGVLFIIVLTTEQIGLVNVLISLGLLFAQLSSLGTSNAVIRFFPYFRDEKKNHRGFLQLMLLIAFVGMVFISIMAFLFYPLVVDLYSEKSPLLLGYIALVFPVGASLLLFTLLENYLRGIFVNVISVFLRDVVLRLLTTIALILFGFGWIGFEAFVIFVVASYTVPVVFLVLYIRRKGEMNRWLTPIQIPRRFKKIIVNFSLFNYVNTLTAVGITTMDAMMIAAFLGLDETGVYTTIIFLASALQVPYRSLVRIAISYIPLYWKDKNMTSMSKLYKDTSSIALLFALSAFLIVWVNRIELFSFLPHSFSDGIWVFLFIMIGRIVDMFFSLNGNILSYSKKYRVDILFTGSLLIVVFWLNYILIPNYGIVGASISTGLAFVLFNTARMLYVWSVFKLNPFQKNQFWMLLIGGITVLITHYTPSIFDNAVLSIFQNVLEISVLFVVPVLYFKLELKVNDYLLYLVKKIRK